MDKKSINEVPFVHVLDSCLTEIRRKAVCRGNKFLGSLWPSCTHRTRTLTGSWRCSRRCRCSCRGTSCCKRHNQHRTWKKQMTYLEMPSKKNVGKFMSPVSPVFHSDATVSIRLKMYSEWEHRVKQSALKLSFQSLFWD